MKDNVYRKGRKAVALIVTVCLSLTALPLFRVSAAGVNKYGHSVTYQPLSQLKYGGNVIKFFDYNMTQFTGATGGKSLINEQYANLVSNGYSLNKFGALVENLNTRNAPNPFNGNISGYIRDNASYVGLGNEASFRAIYDFNLPSSSQYEYFFGSGVYGWHKTSGFITYYNQHETAWLRMLGCSFETESDSYFHASWGGGYAVAVPGNWYSGMLSGGYERLTFLAKDNDNDNGNDAKLWSGMILGRDAEGPKVTRVDLTDSSGRGIPGNTVTLDWLAAHPDRTIYFTLTLSEAVYFANSVTPENVTLKIRTLGVDGTEGSLAEAAFLRYAPANGGNSAADTTQMVFEYQIPDPYTDASPTAQERGFIYDFTRINVNSSDNPVLYSQIHDLSGNQASTSKGYQSAYSVSTSGKVDILPLAVSGVDIGREYTSDTNKEFVNQGELLKIKLTFNKALNLNYTNWASFPQISLNLKRDNTPVTITPTAYNQALDYWYMNYRSGLWALSSSQNWGNSWTVQDPSSNLTYYTIQVPNALLARDGKSITYYYQAVPGHTTLDDLRVAVTAVTPASGTKDRSGYTLMSYSMNNETPKMLAPTNAPQAISGSDQRDAKKIMQGVAVIHPYKLDFTAPAVGVTASQNGDVLVFTSDVSDTNLVGCAVNFNITFNGGVPGDILYKPSSSPAYDDSNWSAASGRVSANAPIVSGKAYMIVKLPASSEVNGAVAQVTAADEAGNTATVTETVAAQYDTLEPRVAIARLYDTSGEKPYNNYGKISVEDNSAYTAFYAWADAGSGEPGPAEYLPLTGEAARYTDRDLTNNQIYYKTLWVKVVDAYNNTTVISSDFTFNNTSAELTVSGANDGAVLTGTAYPTAGIELKNVKYYWYVLAETTGPWSTTFGRASGAAAADFIRQKWNMASPYGTPVNELSDTDPVNSGYQNIHSETITFGGGSPVIPHKSNLTGSGGDTGDILDTDPENAISLSGVTRPVELVIAYCGEDEVWTVQSILFDTRYNAPELFANPLRFSSNNAGGAREDTYRTMFVGTFDDSSDYYDMGDQYFSRPGLAFADEYRSYNMPNLYGFGELELGFRLDNATGLDRVGDIVIEMVKVKSDSVTAADEGVIASWSVDKNLLAPHGDTYYANFGDYVETTYFSDFTYYTYTISFDPAIISDKTAYVTEYDEDGNPDSYLISYEFRVKYDCAGFTDPQEFTAAKFVFDNTGWEITKYSDQGRGEASDTFGTPVIFDENGADVTTDIPLLTYGWNFNGMIYVEWYYEFLHERGARQRTMADYLDLSGDGTLGTGLALRVGTSAANGSIVDAEYLGGTADAGDEGYNLAALPNENEYNWFSLHEGLGELVFAPYLPEFGEYTLYYQLVDVGRNIEGPVEVVRFRKDTTPPVIELTVSAENDIPAREVYVVVNNVYDAHLEGGVWVVDTPDQTLDAYYVYVEETNPIEMPALAVQYLADGETLPPGALGYYDYVDGSDVIIGYYLTPDENGGYLFTNNGFIAATARDAAGNAASYVRINGREEPYEYDGEMPIEWPYPYVITNIDREPPAFTAAPVFTPNSADGSFTVTATPGEDTLHTYIQFDKAYTELLTGDTYASDGDIPRFELDKAPGLYTAAEGPGINSQIYVMDDESVKLTKASLIIEDAAGNTAAAVWEPAGGLAGAAPKITNDPLKYEYGGSLDFSVPVKLSGWNVEIKKSHENLPIYSDGAYIIAYTDVFGRYYTETVIADIFGGSHTFEISPRTPTNGAVTVTITPAPGFAASGATFTLTENGAVEYDITPDGGSARHYSIPVVNIDKTPPEAQYSVALDSAEDAEGNVYIYSAVYSLTGFSEDDVVVEGASSVTFDSLSSPKTHTFTFTDAAGNAGTLTVDASGLNFDDPSDTRIVGYRLTYYAGDRQIGTFMSGQADGLVLAPTNTDVSVKAEALNSGGAVVPSRASEPIIFTCPPNTLSEAKSKTVTLTGVGNGNETEITVSLPQAAIDKVLPSGSVVYVPQESGNIRVYLAHTNTDLAEDGIKIVGQDSGGKPFVLLSDGVGYYTEFENNGTGYFLLRDRAGNTAAVAIVVAGIDTTAPVLGREGWSSLINTSSDDSRNFAANLAKILATPTNNSIKLFLSFNEQIARAEYEVYDEYSNDGGTHTPLSNKGNYVAVTVAGNTVTVEFLQNCQLSLTVFDIRGNACTLWRPEDGPISVIDKIAPSYAETSPLLYDSETNTVSVTYTFNEPVTLTQNAEADYVTEHTLTFNANGAHILTFADKAGNVVNAYPAVTQIDSLAPTINAELAYSGEGTDYGTIGGQDFYTSKSAEFTITVSDDTPSGLSLTFKRLSGLEIAGNNNVFTVAENGVYTITAADRWGNVNSVNVTVDALDRTAPSVRFVSSKAVEVMPGASEDDIKAALLEGITASDSQSGVAADSPAATLPVDIDLSKPGAYQAVITATDNCGNTATAARNIIITDSAGKYLTVNGGGATAGDVFVTNDTEFFVDAESLGDGEFTLYFAKGYKTSAQMKYEEAFTDSFAADAKGYWTIVAQSEYRNRYVFYIYIY